MVYPVINQLFTVTRNKIAIFLFSTADEGTTLNGQMSCDRFKYCTVSVLVQLCNSHGWILQAHARM